VVFYVTQTTAGTTNIVWQNTYHKVVQISGATDVEFTVPYMAQGVLANSDDSSYSLWCTVLSFSQPVSTATTPIYMMVYKAAAEDVKFYQPQDLIATFTPESFPRKDFKKSFEPLHPSMRGYCQENICCGEEILSIRDLMHIMWPQTPLTTNAQTHSVVKWTYDASNVVNGINLYNMFYLFWRGSTNVKLVAGTSNNIGCITMRDNEGYNLPVMDLMTSTIPVMDFSIPYYSGLAFQSIRGASNSDTPTFRYDAVSHTAYYFIGAGDDYTTSYIFPPPAGMSLSAGNNLLGFRGFGGYVQGDYP